MQWRCSCSVDYVSERRAPWHQVSDTASGRQSRERERERERVWQHVRRGGRGRAAVVVVGCCCMVNGSSCIDLLLALVLTAPYMHYCPSSCLQSMHTHCNRLEATGKTGAKAIGWLAEAERSELSYRSCSTTTTTTTTNQPTRNALLAASYIYGILSIEWEVSLHQDTLYLFFFPSSFFFFFSLYLVLRVQFKFRRYMFCRASAACTVLYCVRWRVLKQLGGKSHPNLNSLYLRPPLLLYWNQFCGTGTFTDKFDKYVFRWCIVFTQIYCNDFGGWFDCDIMWIWMSLWHAGCKILCELIKTKTALLAHDYFCQHS